MDNSCDTLIRNAIVVDPYRGLVDTNITIEDGKIKSLTKSVQNIHASNIINANKKYVLPGLIDPHVHYGVFTPIEKAAITESRSGAIGGVTTVIRMLRLYDSYSNINKHIKASIGTHYIDYSIHASILRSEQVNEIEYLMNNGINSFKLYMNLGEGTNLNSILMDTDPGATLTRSEVVNVTDGFILSLLKETSNRNCVLLVHAEDPLMCAREIRKGKIKSLTGLKAWSSCRPPSSEAKSIRKISSLTREFGTKLYFVHIGSTAALEAITAARQKGYTNLYIETCPHYLTHTVDFEDSIAKVVPPIRSKSDVQSTWSSLQSGIINTIGTDHVANMLSTKKGDNDIWSASSGFPGIATMLPVLLSKGVNEGRINLNKVVELTSYNTARIFGMYPRKGNISKGFDADLTIINLDLEQKVTPELLQSNSDYTIYDGWKMRGWPILTMVRGIVVMQNGQVNAETLGCGEFIRRPV